MRSSITTTLAGSALLIPLITGCAVVRQLSFAEPTVDLAAIHIVGLGLNGGTLDLVFAIHNPNPYRLAGKELSADVTLEDTPFGSLTRADPWVLPAAADTTVVLRLDFGWGAVGSAARAMLERGAVRYRLSGRMRVGTTADERWLTISRTGDVPLERLRP